MTVLLADTSLWHRQAHAAVAERWEAEVTADRVAILYSARSARDYDAVADELDGLIPVPCTSEAMDRALDVQRRLAHRGGLHHRSVQIPDLLIAAAADIAGVTVWHYDEDYDRIAAVTGQPMEWVAPRGSL
jgi:predicted nucleic acid-binding protein